MKQYAFQCSEDASKFCDAIVAKMRELFSISQAEAVGRVNRQWSAFPFVEQGDLRYHEDAAFWASQIYYKDSVRWWIPGETLTPKPFPSNP